MGKSVSRRSVARDSASAQLRQKSVADRAAGVSRIGAIGKESVLSRGKRKRFEKRARAERKQDFIDTELRRLETEAGARRAALASRISKRNRSPALSGLKALASALDSVCEDVVGKEVHDAAAETDRPVQKVVREKARRQILADESAQVHNVLEHPSYQDDPMEALRQHLLNTVEDDPLSVPDAFGSTVHQKLKRKIRHEQKGSVRASRKNDPVNKRGLSKDASATKSGDMATSSAAKARNWGIKKNARSAERVEALGRIGVPRPKLSSANRGAR